MAINKTIKDLYDMMDTINNNYLNMLNVGKKKENKKLSIVVKE